jgi:transcriptional regulator with XRE-family HTH domain
MPRGAAKPSANHLRAWREFRGMTQAQLAAKVNTTDNVISTLESGERGLSGKWLRLLAPALETRPGWLLEFDPNDARLEAMEAFLEMPREQQVQALRVINALKTGTEDR